MAEATQETTSNVVGAYVNPSESGPAPSVGENSAQNTEPKTEPQVTTHGPTTEGVDESAPTMAAALQDTNVPENQKSNDQEATVGDTHKDDAAAPNQSVPFGGLDGASESRPIPSPARQVSFGLKAHRNTPEWNSLVIKLNDITGEAGYREMWGIDLVMPTSQPKDYPIQIVLQKFLNANDNDVDKASNQLKEALIFRKKKNPLNLLKKVYDKGKFGNLGLVTTYLVPGSKNQEVFTWNLYGNVKDRMDEVFTPLDGFMDYRVALQELGVSFLNLKEAAEPITAEHDPYKIIQVHDYKGVSFLRQNPNVRAASTEAIKVLALAYPELLKEKYFVNVPAIMGWVYGVIKVFVAEKTRKKFHPMANGANLAAEFKDGGIADLLPKEYGGKAGNGDGTLSEISGHGLNLK